MPITIPTRWTPHARSTSWSSAVSERSMADDRAYVDDVAPAPMMHASDHLAGEVISLDSMRDNLRGAIVTNFEQDDLDVPAFLRKRNEVM